MKDIPSRAGKSFNIGLCDHCKCTMRTPVAILHRPPDKNLILHPKCKAILEGKKP